MRRSWLVVALAGGLAAAAAASGGPRTSFSAELRANGAVRGTLTATLSASTLTWQVRLSSAPRTVRLEPAGVTLCAACGRAAHGTARLRPVQLARLHYAVATARGSTWRGSIVVSHAAAATAPPPTATTTTTGTVTVSGPAGQGWTTNASQYASKVGQRYEWLCPIGGSASDGTVWGTNPFRIDSDVCLAGTYTGDISMEAGGLLVIEIEPGMQGYNGATSNGVTTQPSGAAAASFAVIPDS